MFPPMRRSKQQLTQQEAVQILHRGSSGVLALAGNHDYPYALPISYVYHQGKLVFHCAKRGHKLEAIARNSKASFCVVDQDLVVPEKYTTLYRSVIVFGQIRIVTDEAEKRALVEALAVKYAPEDPPENRRRAIEKDFAPLCILEMTPEHITGKEGIELVRARGGK